MKEKAKISYQRPSGKTGNKASMEIPPQKPQPTSSTSTPKPAKPNKTK